MVRELTETDTDALIDRYIAPYPGTPGVDEAWLPAFGMPVWAIIGDLLPGRLTEDDGAREFHIPREAVDAAIAYYHRHQSRIDSRLAQNRGE